MAGDDGTTLRQHMTQAGVRIEDPEIPLAAEYLYDWFLELSRARSSSGFGINPISHLEIDAWARLYGISPQPHELQIIAALDDAYIRAVSAISSKRRDA